MAKKSKVIERDEVVVRFSGDSGDGMQLTGSLFSFSSAVYGNDISTFPDFPAEIRAPQGTVGGVSGFQVHFGHSEVYTPGDKADVLVAMNPAALKANLEWLKPGATIIIDIDSFDDKNLAKAGYKSNDPIEEDNLGSYNIIKAPITTLTKESLKSMELDNKTILRSKNMYALGLVFWLFNRPLKDTEQIIREKFSKDERVAEANIRVLEDGYNYGVIIQAGTPSYHISPAELKPGVYRNINGNRAIAWGFLLAAEKSGLELFLGSYPITPATEILQELSARKDLGVKVFQAEDEIAGISTAIGASFAGNLGITSTSGPGLALKSEALGLAVMAELPLVVVDVQRGGPSTGLPTKTEQADLLQALYGRNGESPLVVMAASSPVNCFDYAFYAAKVAIEYMTPVILLSDGFLANGTQPWRIPEDGEFPDIIPPFVEKPPEKWNVYERDPEKLNRYWALPGTPGYQHRIGGLEKDFLTGEVSYDHHNHDKMVRIRQQKIDRIADFIPPLEIHGDEDAELLIVGWGGTFGHLYTALEEIQKEGKKAALVHFSYISPLPENSYEVLKRYPKVVVCELNLGQFAGYLRSKFPDITFGQYNKVEGLPFTVAELKNHFEKILEK
ncbi:MAG: transporter [Anaerophaga sp.]|uniref:2-oxoacid:acceptor oxidoreductase subunit alpha n=1 Tax=Anaerophaga thermohalophila TaxID=177400 RepID=UPI000237CC73|nr:2-oxoacid:acceptor oxidoreductase subunit alpha [Anaerophaga thermohalophila]MBZ4676416.1 transporter [Anaerophaga sp.]MDI3520941.1 2-oxoglutarate/2-oxoacid ferredoxin oxidoreductase subunit alpha [Anaerophaga sp.]MDK2841017.1 2-oxoglutarate/2-oxoacid ferredoxin oxidoreductase subunit alpha [Anaerophaga sp.]MDN5290385.1 2-oxoglutarate/2-oxoacid ferredoxin oxidoreductase subunit alpha [Anaerophaga sp.]